jgi:RsmE family RNA methyltransferase
MQAYNPNMPRIELFTSLAEIPLGNYLAVFGDLAASLKISEIRRQPGESAIFFNGPEGGWTDREAALLREKARGVLLSENVLRAETAAIIAAGFLALQ